MPRLDVFYRFADRVVSTAVPLPELQSVTACHADWRLRKSRIAAARTGTPLHTWTTASGYRWATFSRVGHRRVFHFARTAQFVVDFRHREVTCHPLGRTTPDAWRPVLLNQVLPLLLADERLVLHASAVAGPSGALVFVAPPGRGKSTLATALARRGLPLITDDFLVIDRHGDQLMAVPSGVQPRLWPDSASAIFRGRRSTFPVVGPRTSKRRITAGVPAASGPVPLRHVFILTDPESRTTIRSMSPVQAVVALTGCTFVARLDQRAGVRAIFDTVTTLAARVGIQQLAPTRDFEALNTLCDAVSECARAG